VGGPGGTPFRGQQQGRISGLKVHHGPWDGHDDVIHDIIVRLRDGGGYRAGPSGHLENHQMWQTGLRSEEYLTGFYVFTDKGKVSVFQHPYQMLIGACSDQRDLSSMAGR
jgi:hypothetical protein